MKMRTISKPWGQEEIIEINPNYMFKRLTMLKGKRCSLQYHNHKIETIYVLKGNLKIFIGKSEEKLESKIYEENQVITINNLVIHRMEAITDCVYLEASTPEIDDVIRISDDFNRS